MSYDPELPGCFGRADLIFAGHPNDEDRAFAWLGSLRRRGIGLEAALQQIREYLESEGASAEHVKAQRKWASEFLKPWLND